MSELILWGGIFLASLIVLIVALGFLIMKVGKLQIVKKIAKENKKKNILVSIGIVAVFFAVSALLAGMINGFIIIIHVLLFWIILGLINLILKKKFSEDMVVISALVLSAVYLCIALYLCFSVKPKEYYLKTDKDVGSIRVVQFADSHVGTTFDGEGLNEYVSMISEYYPDVVLITGDFVDDSTSRDDMIAACAALSNLDTRYGVYYSFGNHDKGYSDASHRGFDTEDLVSELEKNGVVVLEDEAVLIDNRFYIVGRQDKSEEQRGDARAPIGDIIGTLDPSRYIIVMDHQPNDYDAESQTAADLVLSGHTHGGQLVPINDVGIWIGANDATYGYEQRNGTDFIVTSGISDWEIIFKSGCRSEFVVVDIDCGGLH